LLISVVNSIPLW